MTRSVASVRRNSAASQGEQASRSSGVGLFSGGAQRTAATMRAPISRWPSPAVTLVGWLASPDRCSERKGSHRSGRR